VQAKAAKIAAQHAAKQADADMQGKQSDTENVVDSTAQGTADSEVQEDAPPGENVSEARAKDASAANPGVDCSMATSTSLADVLVRLPVEKLPRK
jgi:hypothetical protein